VSVDLFDSIREYRKAAIQGTTDRGNRIRREEIISRVLRGDLYEELTKLEVN
jgi:hypothetical protein